MECKKKTVPAIRFKGFTEKWVQKIFSELADTRRGLTYSPSNISETGIRVLRSSNIMEDSFTFSDEDVFVDKYAVNIPCVKDGDILITSANGSSRLVGKHTIIRGVTENSAVHGGFMLLAETENPEFLNASMSSEWYRKFISVFIAGGNGAIGNLNKNDLDKQSVPLPNKDEQDKIGILFQTLNHTISYHQQKYHSLQRLKETMLEKMFPKDGADVPEIRFKGFSGAWKYCKLSELGDNTYGGGTPSTSNKSFWTGDIPWIQSSDIIDGKVFGVIPNKHISKDAIKESAAQLVPKNSIAVVTRVGVGKLAFMPFSYSTSQDFLSLSNLKTEPYFTTYSLYKKIKTEASTVQGTSIKGITKEELLVKQIPVPKYDEQIQIGLYFQTLDKTLLQHQQKLEKLNLIKKSLLEKMFV